MSPAAHHHFVDAFDTTGKRRPCTDIPTCVTELADEPHRSLGGMLRSVGGFAKYPWSGIAVAPADLRK